MRKLNLERRFNELWAKKTLSTANLGAGIMSLWGFYQPKVPKRICK